MVVRNSAVRLSRWAHAVLGLSLLLVSCTVPENQRCPDGYEYRDDWKVCIRIPEEASTGGVAGAAGAGGSAANGASSAGAAGTAEGTPDEVALGDACFDQGDCGGSVDYCLLNPLTPDDPGICTIADCSAPACGGDYVCCDCDSVALVGWPAPLCIPNQQESQLTGLGCTCT
jgi:hypothetical protein